MYQNYHEGHPKAGRLFKDVLYHTVSNAVNAVISLSTEK